MIKQHLKKGFYFLLAIFSLAACTKNETRYFADAEDPGIAIFSNTGNNLFSCFIDGKPWRTVSRTTGGFEMPVTRYEVEISKLVTGAAKDTLLIGWKGYFETSNTVWNSITFRLAVAPGFGYKDLNALQGQRLTLDTSNGFFSADLNAVNGSNLKGAGHIYFHTLRLDSIGPGTYTGSMSGLLDADFNTTKITRGRFDHSITPQQVSF